MITKRLFLGVVVALTAVVLTGCNDEKVKPAKEMVNDYEREMGLTSSEIKSEPSVPNLSMCEQILEKWCREYFNECFNGVGYKANSLSEVRIDDINYDGTVIRLSGRHSIEGAIGENYNDLQFEAKITCKGNDNYEVWFNRKKAIGGWQSATRTVYYY